MKAKYFVPCLVLLMSLFLSAGKSYSALIDFETVPGGTPTDQLAVTNQYGSLYGVTFILDDGSTPYLEAVGASDSGNGFHRSIGGGDDLARAGYESQLGSYFLRIGTGNEISAPSPQLIITYTNPVSAASAQIWDIDAANDGTGYEQWLVRAWDSNNNVIDSIYSPVGISANNSPSTSLDALPWTWSFNHGVSADIYQISLTYIGTKQTKIGLSFDNFNTSEPAPVVPEPVSSILFITGGATLGLKRIYKIKRAA